MRRHQAFDEVDAHAQAASYEVDDQLKLGGLLDGNVGGSCAPEDLIHVGGRTTEHVRHARSKTAKALGLTIPPSLLLRADQVI